MFSLKPALLAAAFLLGIPTESVHSDGTLVIVGGGLEADNRAVYDAFLDALPPAGKVVIVSAASASPVASARRFANDLQRYGVDPERIELYPLAVIDDTSTPETDESLWRDGAWDTRRVESLGDPAGFWFTGGDQIRIMETLIRDGSEASPLLTLIRKRLAGGAVVGGTSAGAAIMGRHMIAGGESFPALLEPPNRSYASTDVEQGGRLLLTTGAGFLPEGLVDQHFEARARLGRLVRALAETGETIAYGVGEDTALVVDLGTRMATVRGRGGVTLLDASAAIFDFESGDLARKLAIGHAAPGARFPLGRCEFANDTGAATRGNESHEHEVEGGGGMAFAHRSLEALLGADLLDNSGAARLSQPSVRDDGEMLVYVFSEVDESVGFRTEVDGTTRYSTCGVRFEVTRGAWREARPPSLIQR